MTDDIKELLTLAAKACGYFVYRFEYEAESTESRHIRWVEVVSNDAGFNWAPHLDDGDGARMEGKLDIDVRWGTSFVAAHRSGGRFSVETYADHNNDRQAARRWASLRAAAAIGRALP